MPKKYTTEEFITKAKLIHGNKFGYEKVEYKGSKSKVIIICPKHGDFLQMGGAHLEGKDCLQCVNDNQTCTTEEFIVKARLIHGDLYDYSKTIYQGKRKSIVITCNKHGDFKQIANNHLNGKICKECSNEIAARYAWTKTSFTALAPTAILYKLECFNENERFIKIGITTRTVEERYRYNIIPYDYIILEEIVDSSGAIYDLEKSLHSKYKKQKYIPKIKFAGYTECFSSLNDK